MELPKILLSNGHVVISWRRVLLATISVLSGITVYLLQGWKSHVDTHITWGQQQESRITRVEASQENMAAQLGTVVRGLEQSRIDQLEFYHFWYRRLGAEEQRRTVEEALRKVRK